MDFSVEDTILVFEKCCVFSKGGKVQHLMHPSLLAITLEMHLGIDSIYLMNVVVETILKVLIISSLHPPYDSLIIV